MSYKNVWTLSEQEQGKLKEVSFELLKRGRALADKRKVELVAIVLGQNLDKDDLQKLIYFGADKVLVVDAPELEYFLTDPYVNVVTKLIENHKPEILIASATTTGRTVELSGLSFMKMKKKPEIFRMQKLLLPEEKAVRLKKNLK